MLRVEEIAKQLLADVTEERKCILERERDVRALEETLAELDDRLGGAAGLDGGPVPGLVRRLKEMTADLRRDCVRAWSERVQDWQEDLANLGKALGKTASLAALGELSGSVAHEIRNPLCGVLLSLEVLQTKMDPDDSRMIILRNLRREAEKMEKVVTNLLHFARHYRPRRALCNVRDVVVETMESIRAHLEKKKIRVRLADDDAHRLAEIDPDLMEQVFRNILLNSVDASPEGAAVDVELRVFEQTGEAAVVFRDEGEGMDSHVMARVFDPFFTSKNHGVGLGLSVSDRIVAAHAGRIEVTSQPGQGATFTVVFPILADSTRERAAA